MKRKIEIRPNFIGWFALALVLTIIVLIIVKNRKQILESVSNLNSDDIQKAYSGLLDIYGKFKTDKSKPRGERNNNPGNLIKTSIKWKGKVETEGNSDGHFEQFYEMKYGVRALIKDLINDIGKGKNTITKLITEFAPPSENNTSGYINTVSSATGKLPNEVISISKSFIKELVSVITYHENGRKVVSESDFENAWQLV